MTVFYKAESKSGAETMMNSSQVSAVRIAACLLLTTSSLIATAHEAHAEPPRAAVFPVEFDDASLQGAMQGLTPGDAARLANLQTQLVDWLNRSGRFTATNLPGDPTGPDLRRCDYCATDLARKAGTPFAVVSWVQKVSNLILNINLAVYDVATNTRIAGGSVDIRGDTDESWTRGLFYLLRNRIFVDTP